MGQFVAASKDIRFEAADCRQLYDWVEQVLVGRQFGQMGKPARGLVRRYIEKITGLSRGTGHEADRALHGQRAGPGDGLSAAVRATLHAGRH